MGREREREREREGLASAPAGPTGTLKAHAVLHT